MPVTWAPASAASCTANEPIPPEAPCTSTRGARRTPSPARPNKPCNAVSPASGSPAASVVVTSAGTRAARRWRSTTCSACPPPECGSNAATRSPGSKAVTESPQRTTSPTRSKPGRTIRPNTAEPGAPRRSPRSVPLMLDAATRTRIRSPVGGPGSGTSSTRSTEGSPGRENVAASTPVAVPRHDGPTFRQSYGIRARRTRATRAGVVASGLDARN